MTKQKIISLVGAFLIIVLYYIFNPTDRDFTSFFNNYNKNNTIDNCIQDATTTSHVLQVIDGDTIEVLTPGCGIERVRMIGINTPESVDPNRPIECFGPEASHHAKEILSDKYVILKGDPTQDVRDKYGRLLDYVYLPDGTFFNELMVKEGYAYEYTYNIPYQFQKEFKTDELLAKQNQLGLWASTTCSGVK